MISVGHSVREMVLLTGFGTLIDVAHGVTLVSGNEGISALVAVVEDEIPLVAVVDGVEEHLACGIRLSVFALLHDDGDADLIEIVLAETHIVNLIIVDGEQLIDVDHPLNFFVIEFARHLLVTAIVLKTIDGTSGIIKFTSLNLADIYGNDFLHFGGIGLSEIVFKFCGDVERIDILLLMAAGRAGSKEDCDAEDKEVR